MFKDEEPDDTDGYLARTVDDILSTLEVAHTRIAALEARVEALESIQVLEHSDVRLTGVHAKSLCAGRPCPIHNRSDHHMRYMPQHWRDDTRVIERICPHGVGHPDPDSGFPADDPRWQHGCCGEGCCGYSKKQ